MIFIGEESNSFKITSQFHLKQFLLDTVNHENLILLIFTNHAI